MLARTIIKPVLALVAAALLAVSAGNAQARPQRIVSTNVCADQLVLVLANPAHIASVSSLATDSQISNLAEQARTYRVNHARAEEIIQLQPDLIVGDVQTGRHANRLAASIGVPVHLVAWPSSIADVEKIILDLGVALEEQDQARRIVTSMQQGMGPARPQAVSAMVYEPNGLTTGPGSLNHDVLLRAGLSNSGSTMGGGSYGAVPLERVIMSPPQLLILDDSYAGTSSRAQSLLRHPAFLSLGKRTTIYRIPSKLWLCPGPWVADAVSLLAAERAKVLASLAER
jgi:iron complex transport system substrate-binding protein